MNKKYQKLICAGIFFSIFLSIGFFCLSINIATADDGLNVPAPATADQGASANAGTDTGLADFLKSAYDIGISLGFVAVIISLAVAGVMYLLSPASPDLRAKAKDRVSGAISGLLILLLTYSIVTTINPQLAIFKFGTEKLPEVNLPTPEKPAKDPGVYFYKSGCSDTGWGPFSSNVADLGDLKNKVHSVDVVQDATAQSSYISVLYEKTNFWGRCQYFNGGCKAVAPFAQSASIHKYNNDPNGDGVYFYRKSYFDDSGGFYKVGNGEIRGIYSKKLATLKFQKVPIDEQDCTKYDDKGNCTAREIPSLAGENISSIKIKGSYLVLLVYKGPKDDPSGSGPWTSCQEFPTADDKNGTGPQQIKWEQIRNNGGVIPNYVAIIPI